ncbi:hypothetical protein TanjilG_08220 [Lupinus angustifolius]|uniref:UBC core domain-containing protein n=1 Tax=Lupinus angustifolius TaxID=3871 RepID=A0A1J7HSK6_LUPAN|nr:hypothetical protein TanjilG_08220 [Lupinus angustifolius]
MSVGVARGRLAAERKAWRQNHPHGFVAKPDIGLDGSVNLMKWKCFIPGKAETDWENGHYPITLVFSENYPFQPPTCEFPKGFLHPNVYTEGEVCLSILGYQILVGIQILLNNPNPASPANSEFNKLFVQDRDEYDRKVREQAKNYPRVL